MKNNTLPKIRTYLYRIYLGLIIALLSACSDREISDLEDYVANIKNQPSIKVEPLPDFLPLFPYYYPPPDGKPDPFKPFAMDYPGIGGPKPFTPTEPTHCPLPDNPYRHRSLLEIPLDALEMVGTIQKASTEKGQTEDLLGLVELKSDGIGIIHRVRQGDYLGDNLGKVINISEDKIEILEQLPDGNGCWRAEVTTIPLRGN
jgi:type IV pilus assembly protein PilP